nr:MAG TPA: hypothetical protein [Caudoviricetes sp.]
MAGRIIETILLLISATSSIHTALESVQLRNEIVWLRLRVGNVECITTEDGRP